MLVKGTPGWCCTGLFAFQKCEFDFFQTTWFGGEVKHMYLGVDDVLNVFTSNSPMWRWWTVYIAICLYMQDRCLNVPKHWTPFPMFTALQNGVQGKVLWPLLIKSPQLPGFLYTGSCHQPHTFVHVIPSKRPLIFFIFGRINGPDLIRFRSILFVTLILSFQGKYLICYISAQNCLIDTEWKTNISIERYAENVAICFNHWPWP